MRSGLESQVRTPGQGLNQLNERFAAPRPVLLLFVSLTV